MVELNLSNFSDPIKLFVKNMFWHPWYNISCSSVCFNEFSLSLDISSRWWCHKLFEIHKSTPFPYDYSHGCMDAWCICWIIITRVLGKDIFISGMMTHDTLEMFFKMTLAKVSNSSRTFPQVWWSISKWWLSWIELNFYFSAHSDFMNE